jgi:mRNA interferase YafQ
MRTIKYTAQFKRDYKREKRGQHRTYLDDKLLTVVRLLTTDTPLPELLHDHSLTGNLKDCRDCHIKPDLRAWGAMEQPTDLRSFCCS